MERSPYIVRILRRVGHVDGRSALKILTGRELEIGRRRLQHDDARVHLGAVHAALGQSIDPRISSILYHD